jgi:hypothetical protein
LFHFVVCLKGIAVICHLIIWKIIWNLRKLSNRQISGTCSERPPGRSTSTVAFPHPLSPSSSTSSAMETPEYTEEGPDDPEPKDGDIHMEYSDPPSLLYNGYRVFPGGKAIKAWC